MNVSRRTFVRASSFAGIAAALAATFPQLALGQQRTSRPATFPIPKEVFSNPLYNLARVNFYSNIGTTFTFTHPQYGSAGLRLLEVADLKAMWGKDRPAGKECFSLLFQGPQGRMLRQATYSVKQSKLGMFDLFIVPTGETTPQGMTYEANINRLYP